MFVKNYFYVSADFNINDKCMVISETLNRKNEYMNEVFYDLYKDEIESFNTSGRTALLYIGGAGEHHSLSRNFNLSPKGVMPVKSQLGYVASKTAKRIGNISYLSINSNACASSMFALKEAYELLQNDFDNVIIYGEEWVEEVELMLFAQHKIDLVCSDGFFILHLVKDPINTIAQIDKPSWIWNEDKSPFEVSKDGYIKAMEKFKDYQIDRIKTHGSGTAQNNLAENEAIKEVFGNVIPITEFKSLVGHSQGISTGLEICMLLDNFTDENILVNASGLGNFYGSCYVRV